MYEEIINPYLEHYYKTLGNSRIKDIIKYSVSGGKCVRSFIVKHIIETFTNNKVNFWEPIVSIELLHTARSNINWVLFNVRIN